MNAAAVRLESLQRRLDVIAIDQLRGELARVALENDELRERVCAAEDSADFWSEQATELHLQLCAINATTPGITIDGALVQIAQGGGA